MRREMRSRIAAAVVLAMGAATFSMGVAAAGQEPSSQVVSTSMVREPTPDLVPRRARCGTNGLDLDSRTDRASRDVELVNGTSSGCRVNGVARRGDALDYYCYTHGDDSYRHHTWTFLRDVRTGTAGWARDVDLPRNDSGGRGSPVPCRP